MLRCLQSRALELSDSVIVKQLPLHSVAATLRLQCKHCFLQSTLAVHSFPSLIAAAHLYILQYSLCWQ